MLESYMKYVLMHKPPVFGILHTKKSFFRLLDACDLLTLLLESWLRCGLSSSPITAWMATKQNTQAFLTLLSELS